MLFVSSAFGASTCSTFTAAMLRRSTINRFRPVWVISFFHLIHLVHIISIPIPTHRDIWATFGASTSSIVYAAMLISFTINRFCPVWVISVAATTAASRVETSSQAAMLIRFTIYSKGASDGSKKTNENQNSFHHLRSDNGPRQKYDIVEKL